MILSTDNFISKDEQSEIINYINSFDINQHVEISNVHIKEVKKHINGLAIMHDMTHTEISKYASSFQSGDNITDSVPEIFYTLKDRIADHLNISKDHVFVQIIRMKPGGLMKSHFDTGWPDMITYKCNICVKGEEEYSIVLDDVDSKKIKELTMYSFAANLFKHHVDKYNSERILISYGFIIPCEELGISKNDARMRMANRIVKYYQKLDY